ASNALSINAADPSFGAAGPSTASWQPTPFVSPSAGDLPAVASAFGSATSHSPQGPQAIISEYSVGSPTFSGPTPLSPSPSIPSQCSPMP
ncbi:hypothetical protein BGZ97_004912, partial [Linnemannia gamsii]